LPVFTLTALIFAWPGAFLSVYHREISRVAPDCYGEEYLIPVIVTLLSFLLIMGVLSWLDLPFYFGDILPESSKTEYKYRGRKYK
jgi:hypothetical protein